MNGHKLFKKDSAPWSELGGAWPHSARHRLTLPFYVGGLQTSQSIATIGILTFQFTTGYFIAKAKWFALRQNVNGRSSCKYPTLNSVCPVYWHWYVSLLRFSACVVYNCIVSTYLGRVIADFLSNCLQMSECYLHIRQDYLLKSLSHLHSVL